MTLDFIPHTKRSRMTKARAARIFLARNGICFNCRQQIRAGQAWFIEHPESLAQGGSDADADLWPSHEKCKPAKDAADAKSKAKRDRLVTASWQPPAYAANNKPRWPRRGFPPAQPRHEATRPVRRKSDRSIEEAK